MGRAVLSQCIQWTEDNVANLASDEANELGRWFLRGQAVGTKPIFDGMCAMCGALLFGAESKSTSVCNRTRGPPLDRDGNPILTPDGEPDTDAQPPFLLRFSPSVFAEEVPYVFDHDPATNTLSLRQGIDPPWIVKTVEGKWEYCKDCASQWLGSERVRKSHVPYRDKASQNFMKPVYRKPRGTTGGTQSSRVESSQVSAPEPEPEDLLVEDTAPPPQEPDDMGLEDDIPADIPELVRQYPTLDEYQARWDRLKGRHARPVPGAFSCANLVPQSLPVLWQDCPYVPFNRLVSAESQARLSVCRPHSSLEEASSTSGVPRYSHITGSVDYRRRAPLQLASLLTEDRFPPG